jgi:hypothetical protein
MAYPKASAMNRRGSSSDRNQAPGPRPEDFQDVRCRHCGGSRLKLSYRRRDAAPGPAAQDDPEAGADRTTFIFRCARCEGFTTVIA